nr:MAG TPA: hypothetical protein [Bacteriophage sp.]
MAYYRYSFTCNTFVIIHLHSHLDSYFFIPLYSFFF